jgi:uncharacterized protein (DUF1015 family)
VQEVFVDIRAFRGWRFSAGPAGEVSAQIAPPYDILSLQDKDALLARSATNIVAVDLPHVPPKELGPEAVYAAAAEILSDWKQSGVLVRDSRPALYAYQQTYTWDGRAYARRAILAGVRATPLGRDVIPHEHTFAGPKADRLRLTEKTKMQLSPIFGFYNDSAGASAALWGAAENRPPDLFGERGGVGEALWRIDDEAVIARVRTALADKPVYIADGHHRYTTAMNYADALRAAGEIDDHHEANFVLFALVARSDPGLLVLPTHRIVRGLNEHFSEDLLIRSLSDNFRIEGGPINSGRWAGGAVPSPSQPGVLGVLGRDRVWFCRLKDPVMMERARPDRSDAWRALDVAILHELILDRVLANWGGGEFDILYTPDATAAHRAVEGRNAEIAFLLHGTPLSAVQAVADAGESMPHKSTYFHPKLATGMVLKPLE